MSTGELITSHLATYAQVIDKKREHIAFLGGHDALTPQDNRDIAQARLVIHDAQISRSALYALLIDLRDAQGGI